MNDNNPGDFYGLGESSNTNPTPNPVPDNVIFPMPDNEDEGQYTDFTLHHMRDKNLPYDFDSVQIAKGLAYDMRYMKGEKITYGTANNQRLELTDVFNLNPELVKPLASVCGQYAFPKYVGLDHNTFVSSEVLKDNDVTSMDYKKIFKGKNYIRVGVDSVYPVLDYMKQYEDNRLNIYAKAKYLDTVFFTEVFKKYDIVSDLRNDT